MYGNEQICAYCVYWSKFTVLNEEIKTCRLRNEKVSWQHSCKRWSGRYYGEKVLEEEGVAPHCPNCGSGEYLHNEDGNRNEYCGQCGVKLDWSDIEEY